MKVLLITTTYPTPARPRQGAFNRVLVDALRARHELRVIAPIPWTQSIRRDECDRSPVPTQYPTYFYPPRLLRQHYHHFYWHSIRSSLQQWEHEFTPDVVLGYWLHPDGAAAVRAAARYRAASIVMSGGTDLRLLPQSPGRRSAITRVLDAANRLIVVSKELASQAIRLGVASEKIDVIYRGLNQHCFFPVDQNQARVGCNLPTNSIVVCWAGRFQRVKNPAMLLHAAVLWRRRWGNRLRVVMAGDGPMRNQLQQLRIQLGLQEAVQFTGDLTQSELALRYNAADVTVLTSHSEGIPNVLLESIACGTPFVATDVGGVSEIAASGIDSLVPSGDVDSLARAVIDRIERGPSGRRSFVPTDLDGMADQFDASFARATGNPPVPLPHAGLGSPGIGPLTSPPQTSVFPTLDHTPPGAIR